MTLRADAVLRAPLGHLTEPLRVGLPRLAVDFSARTEHRAGNTITHVKLTNPNRALAFMVHLRILKRRGGDDVLPVLWTDNYVTLMPGEEREVAATYATRDLGGAAPVVHIAGWNVVAARERMPVNAAGR